MVPPGPAHQTGGLPGVDAFGFQLLPIPREHMLESRPRLADGGGDVDGAHEIGDIGVMVELQAVFQLFRSRLQLGQDGFSSGHYP